MPVVAGLRRLGGPLRYAGRFSDDFANVAALATSAGQPLPNNLVWPAIVIAMEACAQLEAGSDDDAMARPYEDVNWAPNSTEFGHILIAAASTCCPAFAS